MKINVQNIDIKSILLSGACFRVIEESDGSFTNILSDRVVNLKQEGDNIIVNSSNMNNIKEVINNYFDLDKDYSLINKEIIKKNPKLKDMVNSCNTYRILNQDPFEMGISYILSSANKVERISNMVNNIANKYGDKVKVYTIGDFSKEICGGPHVEHTGDMGHFKIKKEEAVSSGVRRIKAVLEK